MRTPQDVILEVEDLTVRFPVTGGVFLRRVGEVRAVDHVSFAIGRGETLGLVGESGCGKTTVGRAIVNILKSMAYGVEIAGRILYHHEGGTVDLATLSRRSMRPYRSDIQMVFQDPYASLNPRKTVNQIVAEPLAIHSKTSKAEQTERVAWLLGKVGLSPEQGNRYPHEFSGGQRQRIGIARALATNPKLVIADEPVSALDVSVQAQVLNLLLELRQSLRLTFLFVAHDLSVVRHISDRIAVMYVGQLVELAPTGDIFRQPRHPYTAALMRSVPVADPRVRTTDGILGGEVPSPAAPPSGCYFHPRCRHAVARCQVEAPAL